MKFWFIGDTHYGHANIIKYCNRPFKSLEHMDAELIRKHNSRVKPEDTVIHLGDFCFRNTDGGKEGEGSPNSADYYLKQLNGKIIVIRGNHDKNNSMKTIIENMTLEIGGRNIFAVHNPEDYNNKFRIVFCGHIHNEWKFKRVKGTDLINVGVDVWNFMPVDINEIMDEYHKWKEGDTNDRA